MKKKIILICSILVILITACFLYLKWDAIFQRGNPFPYLVAMTKLSEDNSFVAVDESKGIYISERDNYLQLLEYFKESNNVEFVEQSGSGYIYTNGVDNFVISSEIYWGKYKVWTLPKGSHK